MDLTSIPGIGPASSEKLKAAGVADVAALARATDLPSLAATTGIPPARLAEFQTEARRLAPEKTAGDAAAAVATAVMDAAEDMRVVLRDRAATARVKIGSIWHEDVPIVTARLNEDGAKVMAALKENAVLLKEQATTAVVRVNDEVHANLPIFKERLKEGADAAVEEIRVRVQSIKERAPEAAKGSPLWKRVFGRGSAR